MTNKRCENEQRKQDWCNIVKRDILQIWKKTQKTYWLQMRGQNMPGKGHKEMNMFFCVGEGERIWKKTKRKEKKIHQ